MHSDNRSLYTFGSLALLLVLSVFLTNFKSSNLSNNNSHSNIAAAYTPPSAHPNEPSGMTMLLTHDSSEVQPVGWTHVSGQVSIVNDEEKGNVLQLAMSPMTVAGSGTAQITSEGDALKKFGATKLYISFWEKLSPNYQGNNGAGGVKNMFLNFQETYSNRNPSILLTIANVENNIADPNGRTTPGIDIYNATHHDGLDAPGHAMYYVPQHNESNYPGDIFPRGSWHFFEVVWISPTRGGADGEIKYWVDGMLLEPTSFSALYANGLHGKGIGFSYDGVPRFTDINVTNTWGGGGTPIPADNYYRFKDFYISGGYARAGEQPDHWVLSVDTGGTATPAPGTAIPVKAQLFDANNVPVDIFNTNPSTVNVTGPATWRYRGSVLPGYTDAEHGVQLFWVDVNSDAAPGQIVSISVSDFAKTMNGTVNGNQSISNTINLAVCAPSATCVVPPPPVVTPPVTPPVVTPPVVTPPVVTPPVAQPIVTPVVTPVEPVVVPTISWDIINLVNQYRTVILKAKYLGIVVPQILLQILAMTPGPMVYTPPVTPTPVVNYSPTYVPPKTTISTTYTGTRVSSLPDLSLGATGANVTTLQKFLISQNKGPFAQYLAKQTSSLGTFGPATKNALTEYQQYAGVPATGVLDLRTKTYLKTRGY